MNYPYFIILIKIDEKKGIISFLLRFSNVSIIIAPAAYLGNKKN